MKALLFACALMTSFAALSAELKVLEIPSEKVKDANYLVSRFDVNLNGGAHGVILQAEYIVPTGGDGTLSYFDEYEAEVPAIVLYSNVLTVEIDGIIYECGTMGKTRIFKKPVLRLNGRCDLKVKEAQGMTSVYLITK